MTFENFYEDMGDRPEGMTLDRTNNEGDYCSENCEWKTKGEQARNTRKNKMLTFEGRTQCLAEWSRELGIGHTTLLVRLAKMSVDEAFTKPVRQRKRR